MDIKHEYNTQGNQKQYPLMPNRGSEGGAEFCARPLFPTSRAVELRVCHTLVVILQETCSAGTLSTYWHQCVSSHVTVFTSTYHWHNVVLCFPTSLNGFVSTTWSFPGLYSSPDESSTVSLYSSDSKASWTTSGRLRRRREGARWHMAGMSGRAHHNHRTSRCLGGAQLGSEMPTHN